MTVLTVRPALRPPSWPSCCLVLGLLLLAAPLEAQFPADDHAEILEETSHLVETEWLLGNDLYSGTAAVEIVRGPKRGSLSPTEGGFLYQRLDPSFGVDSFVYRLLADGTGADATATVTLRSSPQRFPLAGRWPTESCHDETCLVTCEPGDQAELGWYDRTTRTFNLCDWDGGANIKLCARLRVPRSVDPGSLPLVIDWDGDGWDEPALQNPQTGTILFLEDSGAPCPGECPYLGNCLTAVGDHSTLAGSASATRKLPLSGRWSLQDNEDRLGVYDPVAGVFQRSFNGFTYETELPFSVEGGGVAVAGDWFGTRLDTPALWSRDGRFLDYMVDETGNGMVRFRPGLEDSFLDGSWPFAAARTVCEEPQDLAFYNPTEREIVLVPLSQEEGRGSTRVNVPTDPNGWPANCEEVTEEAGP